MVNQTVLTYHSKTYYSSKFTLFGDRTCRGDSECSTPSVLNSNFRKVVFVIKLDNTEHMELNTTIPYLQIARLSKRSNMQLYFKF